jgi:hypothetical protein
MINLNTIIKRLKQITPFKPYTEYTESTKQNTTETIREAKEAKYTVRDLTNTVPPKSFTDINLAYKWIENLTIWYPNSRPKLESTESTENKVDKP